MFQNALRRDCFPESSARMREPCFLQNFHNIWISSDLIAFFLSRGQMGANKAKCCLVQRHTNWYWSLLTHNSEQHIRMKNPTSCSLSSFCDRSFGTCSGSFKRVIIQNYNTFWSSTEEFSMCLAIYLIAKISHYASSNTRDLQIANVAIQVHSNPYTQENTHHLFTSCQTILMIIKTTGTWSAGRAFFRRVWIRAQKPLKILIVEFIF